MVTPAGRGRFGLLTQSAASYVSQSYPYRELVIVTDNPRQEDRTALLDFVAGLRRDDIQCVFVEQKLSLGALRNVSIDCAAGDFLCQWDDDDLSHPERLRAQLEFLSANHLDAALLTENLHVFHEQGWCYWESWARNLSRGHPGTMMVRNGLGVRYPETGPESQREEDIRYLDELRRKHRVGYFQAPPFYYIYSFHGANTWDLAHHRMLARRTALPREKIEARQGELLRGINEIAGFSPRTLRFMEPKGPLFDWAPSSGSVQRLNDLPQYRARNLISLPSSTNRSLIHSPSMAVSVELDRPIADAISRMTEFKTLEEHELDLRTSLRAGSPPASVLKNVLSSVQAAGFLISSSGIKSIMDARVGDARVEVPSITSIGILTYNRPHGFARCVNSFVHNMKDHGRRSRIVVMDDSDVDASRAENVAILEKLRASEPEIEIFFADATRKRAYAEELARHSGVPSEVIDFALFNPEHLGQKDGANRNALFLQTPGELFLSVDDDVVCRLSQSPRQQDGLVFTSSPDPTEIWLYPDRDALLSEHPAVEQDVLSLHERLLGKETGSISRLLPETDVSFAGLSAYLLDLLETRSAKVRVTWSGLYGDSGASYPTYYLWKDESVQEQLTASEETYRRITVSREVFRAPRRTSIGDSSYCQSTMLAFDHRGLLPPFMPVQRGSDILFGRTLRLCFKASLIGYLPWAILHSPIEARSNAPEDIVASARRTSMCEVMDVAFGTFSSPYFVRDERDLLVRLGEHLRALGRLPPDEFEEILRLGLWARASAAMQNLETALRNSPNAPLYWSNDIRGHIAAQRERLDQGTLWENFSFGDRMLRSIDERLRIAQRLVLRFGEMLKAWPMLIEAAGDLRQRGITLAQGVGGPNAF